MLVVFAATTLPSAVSQAPGRPVDMAALPDAPVSQGSQNESLSSTGSPVTATISGRVVDANGRPVEGARISVTLTRTADEPFVASEADGTFILKGLPQGKVVLTVAAPGLQSFVSVDVLLSAGEAKVLPDVVLSVAGTTQEVTVTATQVEIAQAQVKQEEKQRVLGIVPNFYSSYIWDAAPLDTRQKFDLALHSILDPVNLLATGAIAGGNQITGRFAGYGPGAKGYAKRYGSAFADDAITRVIVGAALPTLLHQDPRYFYKGTGSKPSRILYAITRSVITRGDNGRAQPNYSRVLGGFAGGAISNAYHPAGDRGVGLTISNGFIEIGGNAADNLLREFLFRRFTSKVPDYATGQAKPSRPAPTR